MDIRKKMAKGAFWLLLEKGSRQISSFVVFAVIARMIGPEEYGLVALCGILVTLTNNVMLGFVDSIISMRIRDDERLSSLFWIITFIGAIFSLITFVFAPFFAIIFEYSRLNIVLQAFAILPFLFALSSVPTAMITANMNFRVFTIRTIFASVIGGGVGIICAMNGLGAISLAVQQIVSQVVIIAIVWMSISWKPKFIFNMNAINNVMKLGSREIASWFVIFMDSQVPRLILGYFVGPIAVGYYAFIIRVCGAIQDGIIQPVLNVLYPAICDVIDDQENKIQIIQYTIFIIGFILFPIVAAFVVFSDMFVPLLFGIKWIDSVLSLKIYALAIPFIAINIAMRNIMRAHREIGSFLRVQIIVALIGIFACLFSVNFGLNVVIMAKVVTTSLASIAYIILVNSRLKLKLFKSCTAMLSPLLSSVLMVLFVKLFMSLFLIQNFNLIAQSALIAFSFLIYFLALCILERDMFVRVYKKIIN